MHETHTGKPNILILRPYLWSKKGEEEFPGGENAEKNPSKDMAGKKKKDLVKVIRGI